VRDLAEPERPKAFAGRAGRPLPGKAVMFLVVVAVIAFELLLVSWFVSQL
jgi:hypothetical protein